MAENKNLPPDLDARILAEAAMGAHHADIVLTISPRGTPHDHLTILRRIDALLDQGALVSTEYRQFGGGSGECLVASVDHFAGGVAA